MDIIMRLIPLKGGQEYDSLTRARKRIKFNRGHKWVKRKFNKRWRKIGKTLED